MDGMFEKNIYSIAHWWLPNLCRWDKTLEQGMMLMLMLSCRWQCR